MSQMGGDTMNINARLKRTEGKEDTSKDRINERYRRQLKARTKSLNTED
jgi:hypothetical protein